MARPRARPNPPGCRGVGAAVLLRPSPHPHAELGPRRAGCWKDSRIHSSTFPPLATLHARGTWDSGSRQSEGLGAALGRTGRPRPGADRRQRPPPFGWGKGNPAEASAFSLVPGTKRSPSVRDFASFRDLLMVWWGARVCKAWRSFMEEFRGPEDGLSYADQETPSLALCALSPTSPQDLEACGVCAHYPTGALSQPETSCPRNPSRRGLFCIPGGPTWPLALGNL